MMTGGIGDEHPADMTIQSLIESPLVKPQAQEKYGKEFADYRAVSYKSQVVAGTNYFVKVDVGNGEFVHMRVFKPLPYLNSPPSLEDIQLNKTKTDDIAYF